MEKEEIQLFLAQNGKYLPRAEITRLCYKLELIEDKATFYRILSIDFKNPTLLTVLYWLCPGFLFIDRFFTGQHLSGLIKFIIPIVGFPIGFFLIAKIRNILYLL